MFDVIDLIVFVGEFIVQNQSFFENRHIQKTEIPFRIKRRYYLFYGFCEFHRSVKDTYDCMTFRYRTVSEDVFEYFVYCFNIFGT